MESTANHGTRLQKVLESLCKVNEMKDALLLARIFFVFNPCRAKIRPHKVEGWEKGDF